MCEMSLGDIHLDLKTIVHYQKVQTLPGKKCGLFTPTFFAIGHREVVLL